MVPAGIERGDHCWVVLSRRTSFREPDTFEINKSNTLVASWNMHPGRPSLTNVALLLLLLSRMGLVACNTSLCGWRNGRRQPCSAGFLEYYECTAR